MKRFYLIVISTLLSLGVAPPSLAALSPEDACRGRVAKEGRKFFGIAYKARQQCRESLAQGSLQGIADCAVEPRAALKISRAAAKLEQKIRRQCTNGQVVGASFAGACDSAATVDDLVTCVRESHLAAVVSILDDLGGPTLIGNTAAQRCRKTAATEFRKVADKRLKEAWKCRDLVDKGRSPDTTNCVLVAEASEKIAKFEERARQKVEAACGNGPTAPIADAAFPAPCSADIARNLYSCERCRLAGTTNELMRTQGLYSDSLRGLEPAVGACIPRDATQIARIQQSTANALGFSWELEFYRNNAYSCGISGNYTFLVMNPAGDPGAEARLWVYLHGGGVGYYDNTGTYVAVKNQTENTWNHEETFSGMWETHVIQHTFNQNTNQPIDSTLKRRIEEGYRVLVVSMCDHDVYGGLGTPYTNNPLGGEVNGLQATMAAIDYTVANYPTTQVFAHGTSAGSIGVWALQNGYLVEGKPLTATVADSWIATPRIRPVAEAFSGEDGYPFGANFEIDGMSAKIGYFAREDIGPMPEVRLLETDFQQAPALFIAGNDDPFCGGNQAPLAEAVAEGLTNCNWLHDGLRQTIDSQESSPHELNVLTGFGHVPTNGVGPANDIVDTFLESVLSTNPPNFDSSATNPGPAEEPEAILGASFACPWDESDPTLHVFLAAGQSNMVSAYGQPGTLPSQYETGIDQLQMWDQGSWKRLGLSLENGNSQPRYGPELAFAWTLHAACPNSNIGIIKYAVGGTSIDTWVPTGENAAVLQGNVTAALLARPDITFEGFLYHQGGGDSRTREQAESWGDDFISIVDFTRAAGPTPGDLPFFVATSRIGDFPDDITDLDPDSIPSPDPSRPFIVHVVHQQWMVQFERPGIYPTINRDIPKGADGIHDSPEGIRTKGRNFAETFLEN